MNRLAAVGGLTKTVIVDMASIQGWCGDSTFNAVLDALVESANVGRRTLLFVGATMEGLVAPHVNVSSTITVEELLVSSLLLPAPVPTLPTVVAAETNRHDYLLAPVACGAANVLDISDGRLWDKDTTNWTHGIATAAPPAATASVLNETSELRALIERSRPAARRAHLVARVHRANDKIVFDEVVIDDGTRTVWTGHAAAVAALDQLIATGLPLIAPGALDILSALYDAGARLPPRLEDPALACFLLDPDQPAAPAGLSTAMRRLVDVHADTDRTASNTSLVLDELPSMHAELRGALHQEGLLSLYEGDVSETLPIFAQIEREGFRVDPKNLDADILQIEGDMRLEEQTIFADLAGEVAKGFRRIDLLNAPDEEVGPLVRWAATTPLPPDWKHNRHIFERYTQFGDPRALAIHRLRHLSAVHDWLVRLTTASRVRGRLRPSTTGRWYPHHVELAAVPKHSVEGLRLRGHLVPPPGEVFVAGDYQAFEPHILAHEIQDPSLVQACATGDCYENLAPHLGLTPADRSIVKKAMLALTYRITPDSFTASLPMPLADGHRLYRKLERHLTKTIAFRKKFGAEARRSGEARSLWGWRRRWQPGVGPQAFERKAFNLLAQGSAADILRALLRALHAVLPPGVAIVHQEFDAVILRCPAELAPKVAADLKQTMEHIAPLRVQLKARIKIGPTLAAVS